MKSTEKKTFVVERKPIDKRNGLSGLKKVMQSELGNASGALIDIMIEIFLFVALIPTTLAGITALVGNSSGTEKVIYTIVPLFIALSLLFMIGKSTGVLKKK